MSIAFHAFSFVANCAARGRHSKIFCAERRRSDAELRSAVSETLYDIA